MDSPAHIIALLLLFFAHLLSIGVSSSDHKNNFLECLNIQFESSSDSTFDVIHSPSNESYASLLQPYNLRVTANFPQKPLLIVTPFHESEIQAAVYCSKKLDIQIRTRSGGHDFEGLSYISRIPFIILDMRNLRSISINAEEETAWVQTGATLGELYYTIAQTSKTLGFPAGVSPTVGIGGYLSGGGYSMMSRKYSIAADHIIDAKLINANGQVLDRKSMGEDLFWAMRGGGGASFGILVAFKVKLVTVPEIVTVFNISRSLEQNATQLVHKWQYIADKIDDNLLIRLFFRSAASSPTDGNRAVIAFFTSLFLGRALDLLPLMQETFPELGLVEQDCTEMSWIESVLYFAGLHNQSLDVLLSRAKTGRYFKIKSEYVRQPIPVRGLRGLWRFLNEEVEQRAEVQFSPYGGAITTFSESETPFPHRSGNIFMMEYWVCWTKPGNIESERHLNWTRRLYNYLTPFVSEFPRGAYLNYRDLDIGMNNEGNTSYEQASVWGFKYFKNNFNRLVHVKTKVDPSNFFRNEQSIPPFYQDIRNDILASS